MIDSGTDVVISSGIISGPKEQEMRSAGLLHILGGAQSVAEPCVSRCSH